MRAALSLKDLVLAYIAETPKVRPIALRLTMPDEDLLIRTSFPHLLGISRQYARKLIQWHFGKIKPSGIEIIVWGQDYTKVCFPVPNALT